jgi:Omp85 superfamily domain
MPALVTLALALAVAAALCVAPARARAQTEPPPATAAKAAVAAEEPEKPDSGWAGLPIVTYAPETELALGAFGSHFFRIGESTASSRPSSVSAVVLYTFRNQLITELIPELYWNSDHTHLWTKFDYRRYPNRLWAIGPNSPNDSEEPYTENRWRWQARMGQMLKRPLFLYGHVRLIQMTLEDEEPGGLLATDQVPGAAGGLTFEFGPGFAWDTRDHALVPHRGAYYDFRLLTSQPALGSAYEYTTLTLDLRQYLPVMPGHTVAGNFYIALQDGQAPFYLIPQLGGSERLRGYLEGRFRDNTLMLAQVEYRLPLIWRFGGVVFAGVGNVARTFREFGNSVPKWSLGGGLRFLLNADEKLNLRADFGFGRDTFGFYINAGEVY